MSIANVFLENSAPEITKVKAYGKMVDELSGRVEEINDFIDKARLIMYGSDSGPDYALKEIYVNRNGREGATVSLFRYATEDEIKEAKFERSKRDKVEVVPIVNMDVKLNYTGLGDLKRSNLMNTTVEWKHLSTGVIMAEGIRINKDARPSGAIAINQIEELVSSFIIDEARKMGNLDVLRAEISKWKDAKDQDQRDRKDNTVSDVKSKKSLFKFNIWGLGRCHKN